MSNKNTDNEMVQPTLDEGKKGLIEAQLEITQFGIDNAAIGIFRVDEAGTILYVNKHAAISLGYTRDELNGMSLFTIDTNFNNKRFTQHRQQTQKSINKTIISSHKRKDGTIFPVEVTINYFKYNDQYYSFSFVKNISEELNAENELKKREEMFRSFFEATNAGKSITQITGEIHVNQAFCDMLGYKQKELEQKKWQEITPQEDIEIISEQLKTLLQGKTKSSRFEKRYIRKNGSICWADVSVVLRYDEQNNPLYYVTTIIDITDQKRAQEDLIVIKQNLQNEVNTKTKELQDRVSLLERFRDATIEREFRIKELTDEVTQLQKKLNITSNEA